jgi:coniferyl-aldehyde dehydrogenase
MSLAEVGTEQSPTPLRERFERQSAAFRQDVFPTAAVRRERVGRLIDLLRGHREALVQAVSADFGHRSRHETLMADVLVPVTALTRIRRRLGAWMRPERRPTTLSLFPGSSSIVPQPLGVVGIVSPWNYPVVLGIVPLAYALAAGNRAMLKPSELTPRTSALLAELLSDRFPDDLVAVVNGGPDVGAAFTALPFDHLVFTGSTRVGREVAVAAARNLVPVTLELGGKSPAVVHPDYPLATAARRIVANKVFNAGQTCISPDYVVVREDQVEPFVAACRDVLRTLYPPDADGSDYTAIVNDRQAARLHAIVEDARARGARIVPLVDEGARWTQGHRKMAPVAIVGAKDGMAVLEEEIFGPVLPVVGVPSYEDALEVVRSRPRPLAMYLFDHDRSRVARVLETTHAGGVAVNDCMVQFAAEHLPFGGIGPSGMGVTHGREGFDRLSHRKPVFRQSRLHFRSLSAPPFGRLLARLIAWLIG